MKKIAVTSVVAMTSTVLAAAVPKIHDAHMSQADSRLVTITYTLANAPAVVTVDVQTNATGDTWASIGGEAVWNATGDVWKKVGDGLAEGDSFSGTILWRPDRSWPDHEIADGGARAVVTAWALDNTPDYMVVDISSAAQSGTQTYYPSADFVPGGVSNSLYKTTTLLMRKIMASDVTWTMGSTALETQRNATREGTHLVTLTNNYYIGVYQITQAQWALLQPSRPEPSYFSNATDRAMRPVEQVCYNEIRCSASSIIPNTSNYWPRPPHTSSFLGQLRLRTGLDFDLPSEAQWEFAARAGNGDTKWGDGSGIQSLDNDENLRQLGRYASNGGTLSSGGEPSSSCGATNGTAIVGSYAPNAWGLYDTSGNVWEWCLDWMEDNITTRGGKVNIDPTAPENMLSGKSGGGTDGGRRVMRGGAWSGTASSCRPAMRSPALANTRGTTSGFRVVVNMP